MVVEREEIRVTFTDMTRQNILFELNDDWTVVAIEEGGPTYEAGTVSESWVRNFGGTFHEWCARYVHLNYEGVFMTESTEELCHVR